MQSSQPPPSQQSHRSITIGLPQSKSNEKIIPEQASGVGQRLIMEQNYKIYNYGAYTQQPSSQQSSSNASSFHKDLNKSKSDSLPNSSLPTPPPLMSDIKQSGVIVKHDTNVKSSPIQIVHSSSKQPTAHYQSKVVPIHGQSHYDYRSQPQNDRYKSQSVTVLPSSQPYHGIPQNQQPPPSSHQLPVTQQNVHYNTSNISQNVSSKSKLPTPAQMHFYGKPSTAGIVSGIPVCRSQDTSVYVTKSSSPSSPSPYQSQNQHYGPPPAHSRNPHDYRIHQQSPGLVGTPPSGIVGSVAKSTLPHSIPPHHHHHPHHLSTSPPTQIPVVAPHTISRSPGLIPPNVGTPPHNNQIIGSVQTQPLDLGVSNRDDNSNPPKRKGTPIHHPIGSPIAMDVKKKKLDVQQNAPLELRTMSPHVIPSPTLISSNSSSMDGITGNGGMGGSTSSSGIIGLHININPGLQNLSKNNGDIIDITTMSSSNPATAPPPPASAAPIATTIIESKSPNSIDTSTTNNNSVTINLSMNSSSSSSTPPIQPPVQSVTPQPQAPPQSTTPAPPTSSSSNQNLSVSDTDGATANSTRFSSANSSPSQSPGISGGPPTPAKSTTSEPDKSSSPAPKSSAPRHLKKAWLQRHTGEDVEDRTGIVGGGSCVKLPLTTAAPTVSTNTSTNNSTTSNPLVHSLHTVGTMAVNSINKTKSNSLGSKGVSGSQQQHPKKSLVSQGSFSSGGTGKDNGHNSDSDLEDNSSSSDQVRRLFFYLFRN